MQSSSCPGNHQTYLDDPGCHDYRFDDRKMFELSWFDKLCVEMDLAWF